MHSHLNQYHDCSPVHHPYHGDQLKKTFQPQAHGPQDNNIDAMDSEVSQKSMRQLCTSTQTDQHRI